MNILLVNPYSLSDSITPPVGLGFLSAAVNDIARVTVRDLIKDSIWEVDDFEKIVLENNYNIIGFKTIHSNYLLVDKYLTMIKKKYPGIVTVVGGPEASILRSEMMKIYKNKADFIIAGEGEAGFRKLCLVLNSVNFDISKISHNDLSEISGLSTVIHGQSINNPVILNNDIGEYKVDWEVLKPHTYPPIPHAAFARRFPVTSIAISRGCPFLCTFCAAYKVFGRKTRYRNVSTVLDEIELLQKKYGIKEFQVIDDNFTCQKEYVMEFCEKLIQRNLNIEWTLPNGTRIDSLDEEMLSIMRKSGNYSMSIGIESGSPRILKLMKKNLDLESTITQVRMIKKAGIRVAGFFILGYYSETEEDIRRTINYAIKIPIDRAQFMLFHPYPGTEAYELVKKNLKYDPDTTFAEVSYVPETLTEKKLKHLQRLAFFHFYLRPRILLVLIYDIFHMQGKLQIIKRIFRWLS